MHADRECLAKGQVPGEFDRVARRYDLLTSLNPGYHRHLGLSAQRLSVPAGGRILDLCCGTGASTSALLAAYPSATVTAADASRGMLNEARRKLPANRVELIEADAMDPGGSEIEGPFDAIFMAYGIRNMPDPDRCLENLLDLLRPGGAICLHEYSVADSRWARVRWQAVSAGIIIPGGLLASGSARIFRYLRRSVLEFDGVRALENRLRNAGFVEVRTEPMDGWQAGIVHSFLGRRPEENG